MVMGRGRKTWGIVVSRLSLTDWKKRLSQDCHKDEILSPWLSGLNPCVATPPTEAKNWGEGERRDIYRLLMCQADIFINPSEAWGEALRWHQAALTFFNPTPSGGYQNGFFRLGLMRNCVSAGAKGGAKLNRPLQTGNQQI